MFTLNCKGSLLIIEEPIVMGILNLTPDSFFTESRNSTDSALLNKVEAMISEGATIIDIGGQSTAPASKKVDEEEELRRIIPAIELIHQQFPNLLMSVDTYYSRVAREAVDAGVSIVNDISSGMLDKDMITTVSALRVPYIAMHMKGTPQTMTAFAQYENITLEIIDFFIERLTALRNAGINDIIIDPGFGFAKNIAQNFELLRNMKKFEVFDIPVLAGLSRKSTIYKTLGITPEESLNGTSVLNTMALINGASILRVHDVKPAMECIKLFRSSGFSVSR